MEEKIEFSGFKDINGMDMDLIRKKVTNFATDVSEADEKFRKIHMTLKKVHERADNQIYEIQAKLVGKETITSDVDDRNLLAAIDTVLKKLSAQMQHRMHA
jgi:ribosome-associated translation inhibitor RaiA